MDNNEIIETLYQYKRDASSTVRGYLYQDLIAIDELLKNDVDYVCVEYVEDVLSIYNDGTMHFIQSKYYPESDFNTMKEAIRDLYFQYLSTKLCSHDCNVIPTLVLHTKKLHSKPDVETIKNYISTFKVKPPAEISRIIDWIKTNNLKKKEDSIKELFCNFAHKQSICEFHDALVIITDKGSYVEYREKIAEKLTNIGFNSSLYSSHESFNHILLGLSTKFVQESYVIATKKDTVLQRKNKQDDFIAYLRNVLDNSGNECIVTGYLRCIIDDYYHETLNDNLSLDGEAKRALYEISKYTKNWLDDLCSTAQGQYRLLNTISTKKEIELMDFEKKTMQQRIEKVHEHRDKLDVFLGCLWKIIMNINSSPSCDFDFETNVERLNPISYIDMSNTNIIQLVFDRSWQHANFAILSSLDSMRQNTSIENILGRMMGLKDEFRPRQWYMAGTIKGQRSYGQNVADIRDDTTVSKADVGKFYIECMACIKVDKNCWDKCDDCYGTIFSEICKEKGLDKKCITQ